MKCKTLQPGRELDLLVAEKVMGWTRKRVKVARRYPSKSSAWNPMDTVEWEADALVKGDCIQAFNQTEQPYNVSGVPPYSTDVAASWQVIERLREADAYEVSVTTMRKPHKDGSVTEYFEAFYEDARERRCAAEAKTAPHAICLMALEVVSVG